MQALPRPLRLPALFPLQKGLVGWWPFDERSGAQALDRSGKLNHGTLEGPTWVAGRRGSALSFDGTTDYISIPHASSLNLEYFTIAMLFKTSKTGVHQAVLSKGLVNGLLTNYGLHINATNTLSGRFGDEIADVYLPGVTTVTDGVWHYGCVTYDKSYLRLYLDGVSDVAPLAATETPYLNDKVLSIGMWNGTNYPFTGVINKVRIYNRGLTAAECKRLGESELMLVRH